MQSGVISPGSGSLQAQLCSGAAGSPSRSGPAAPHSQIPLCCMSPAPPFHHQMVASSSIRPTETCHTFPPPRRQHSGPSVTSSLAQTTKTNPILFREAQSRCISDSKRQTDFYFKDITTEDSREHLPISYRHCLARKTAGTFKLVNLIYLDIKGSL